MAKKYTIGAGIVLEGEQQFKKAVKDINSDLNVLNKEMTLVNTTFSENTHSMEALTAKQEIYDKKIETQKEKVNVLKQALEAVKKEYGENSTEVNKWASQLLTAQTALIKTEKEADKIKDEIQHLEIVTDQSSVAFDKAEEAVEEYDKALDRANTTTVKFSDLAIAHAAGDLLADGFRRATSAVGDFIKQGITLASDLQEVQNVVDTTFGNGAAQIYTWSDAAAESFGMSSLAAQQYNGTMGSMLKAMGLTDDAVLKMSTDMVGLAGDIASFHNLDVQTAFEKIRSGISGETEPLKQLGIDMSVANLEAYALAQGIETVYSKMTSAEKATLRYNYLIEQTADVQGDYVRTSDSFANQQKNLQLQADNLAASFGEKLLPSLNNVLTTANEKLPKLENTVENIGKVLGVVTEFALDNHEAILGLVAAYVSFQGVSKAGNFVSELVSAFKQLLPATKAATAAQEANNVAVAANPYVLLASAIAAVTVGLISLASAAGKASTELREAAEESVQAYEEQTEKVAGLEKELDDTKKKIEEIQSKGKLNLTDAQELANLQVQNDKLSTQLEIEKEILETKRQQAEIDLNKAVTSDDSTQKGTVANVEWLIGEYEQALNDIEQWQGELNRAIARGDEKRAEEARQTIANFEQGAREYKLQILEETASLNELAKNLDRTKDIGQQTGAAIDSLNKKVTDMFDISTETTVEARIAEEETYAEYKQREGERQLAAEQEQNAEALADYEEKLQNYVDVLDENLVLRKIDEDKYYEFLEKRLAGNVNKESKLYYKQLERVEAYHKKRSDAADKAAAEEEKSEKARQDAVTKAQKEAEEERVNAIKASWDKITRMHDRGEITDEAEYKAKAQIVKKYCDENEDTWDSYYKWLYDYTKKQEDEIADAKLKAWEDNSKKLSDTLEKSYEDIKKQKEQVKKDLQGIDLTETVKGKNGEDVLVLTDLDAEIKKIDKYEASLEKLRQSGISDSLMNAIMEKSYASGDRQAFIDQLLGLSPEKLQLYYDDWERYQAKLEEAADNSVADKLEGTNQAVADGVKDIFRNIPSEAYAEGVETARQYLQGIIDSMGDVDAAAALRLGNIADRAAVQSNPNLSSTEKLIASGKLIPASTPINIILDSKKYVETTIGNLISKGQISGGNIFNL